METYVVALDQGTTTSRAISFNQAGEIVSRAQYPFRQIYPQPGWVEHDPMEIWATQKRALAEAVGHTDSKQIAAIGVTNQRETTILWDRTTGEPIYNAIVWQCRRTAPICDWMKREGLGDLVAERTGLLIDAYFSGTKLKWLLDEIPGARERAQRGELCAGTVDSWLIWRLTGGRAHVTDYSNASRTMLFNIHTLEWDAELCRILDIPMSLLPQPQQRGLRVCGRKHTGPGSSGGDSHLRQRWRSACGAVRPGLLCTGTGEKYLWNRLFYLDECGRAGGAVRCGTGDVGGLVGGRPDDLRTGGQCVQCRQYNPVAAG